MTKKTMMILEAPAGSIIQMNSKGEFVVRKKKDIKKCIMYDVCGGTAMKGSNYCAECSSSLGAE